MDSGSEWLGLLLMQLASSLPTLIVCIGGIVLAVMLWGREPRAALLVTLGLSLLLLTTLMWTCLWTWVDKGDMLDFGDNPVLTALGFVRSLMLAGGLGLVIAAAFVGRGRPPEVIAARPERRPPPEEPPEAPPGVSPHVTADRPRQP